MFSTVSSSGSNRVKARPGFDSSVIKTNTCFLSPLSFAWVLFFMSCRSGLINKSSDQVYARDSATAKKDTASLDQNSTINKIDFSYSPYSYYFPLQILKLLKSILLRYHWWDLGIVHWQSICLTFARFWIWSPTLQKIYTLFHNYYYSAFVTVTTKILLLN
jgi:hypothetical protein